MSTQPSEPFPKRLEHDLERAEEWLDEEVVTLRRTLHRDVKLQMRWLILALIVACGLGIGLGWGQAQSSYHKTGASFAAIETTLTQHGLRICSSQTISVNRLRGVAAAEVLVLGFHSCPAAGSGQNLLTVYQFSSGDARNAAALTFLGGRGRAGGFGPQGSIWTYGPYLIVEGAEQPTIVDALAHNGLKDLGGS